MTWPGIFSGTYVFLGGIEWQSLPAPDNSYARLVSFLALTEQESEYSRERKSDVA